MGVLEEGTQRQEQWVLQARLADGSTGWEELGGFAYGSREELQAAYDSHFAAIDGQGCVYRFAHYVQVLTTEYAEPAPARQEAQ